MVNINIVCPICKSCKDVKVPEFLSNQKSNLLTISIPKGMICEHHFQAFLDKKYVIRGYQKVDIELTQEEKDGKVNPLNQVINDDSGDNHISENFMLEDNTLRFIPKNIEHNNKKILEIINELEKTKKMSLKDIYNEFWEFIDDQNVDFIDFIRKDKKKATKYRENKNLSIKQLAFNLQDEIINDNQ